MRKWKSGLVYCLLAQLHGCAHLGSRLDMRFREARINELMASREEFMLVLRLENFIILHKAISGIA